jgi:hypothetical protein
MQGCTILTVLYVILSVKDVFHRWLEPPSRRPIVPWPNQARSPRIHNQWVGLWWATAVRNGHPIREGTGGGEDGKATTVGSLRSRMGLWDGLSLFRTTHMQFN